MCLKIDNITKKQNNINRNVFLDNCAGVDRLLQLQLQLQLQPLPF